MENIETAVTEAVNKRTGIQSMEEGTALDPMRLETLDLFDKRR